ncbi:MAG: Ig-like domain-containing protein [Paludibacteraceae bacterium]
MTFITTNNNNSLFAVQPYIDANGNLIYTPASNASGVATVTVKIKDDGGTANGGINESATQTFTITINPVNDAPAAINDINTTFINSPVSGNVLTNDSDVDGNALTVNTTPVSGPSHGTVTLNTDGTYTYTPAIDYTGKDSFIYQVCDNGSPSLCSTATVFVNVLPKINPSTNNPPIANNDTYTVENGETATVKVLANDSDPDGNTLSVTSVTGLNISGSTVTLSTNSASPTTVYDASNVSAGTAYVDASGNIVFTPITGYTGNVPFNYSISDGMGECLSFGYCNCRTNKLDKQCLFQ